jgi:hypothetical protein
MVQLPRDSIIFTFFAPLFCARTTSATRHVFLEHLGRTFEIPNKTEIEQRRVYTEHYLEHTLIFNMVRTFWPCVRTCVTFLEHSFANITYSRTFEFEQFYSGRRTFYINKLTTLLSHRSNLALNVHAEYFSSRTFFQVISNSSNSKTRLDSLVDVLVHRLFSRMLGTRWRTMSVLHCKRC